MTHLLRGGAAVLTILCCSAQAQAPAPDTPANYGHAIALTVSGKNAVVQLRLPAAAYLNARSASLDDLRVFDASGKVLPFTLLRPSVQSQQSRRQFPVKVFPVGMAPGDTRDVRNDVEIKTAADGSVTSISTRRVGSGQSAGESAGALVLDLGTTREPIAALVFALPDGVSNYQAQVELEVSDDLRSWETMGYASLNWLANSAHDTLASNRMEFDARAFRYARLSWRQGKPIQFASIMAESQVSRELAAAQDSISLAPHAGRFPNDLAYDAAPALPVSRFSLRFTGQNVVVPAAVGHYVELPNAKGGATTRWEFSPRLQTTFFQVTQDGKQRGSGDIALDEVHAANWVVRPQTALSEQPQLRLSWTPATLVFLGSGAQPYTLRFGREHAQPAGRDIAQVAPGFSEAELQKLEYAVAGPDQVSVVQPVGDSDAKAAGDAARMRMFALWAVLLAGVGVLAFMAWKLIGQMNKPE